MLLSCAGTADGRSAPVRERALNANPRFEEKGASPKSYTIEGDAVFGAFPAAQSEQAGRGVRFVSSGDGAGGGEHLRSGSIRQTVKDISPAGGRWFRFRIRALALDGFHVQRDDLYLKVEFFRDHGTNALDSIKKEIYSQVEKKREDFRDPQTNRRLGVGTWQSYELVFRTPFPEVDTLTLTAGFGHGTGNSKQAEFWINEFELVRIPEPDDYAARQQAKDASKRPEPPADALVPLGGRWYYDPRGADSASTTKSSGKPHAGAPTRFDASNADRLYYRTDHFEAPFADNMQAWLRKGWLDLDGQLVTKDRLVKDNVVLEFTKTELIMRSHNLPNHPTAVFPDRWRALDGNPNYIQEQRQVWRIPLEPKVNPNHVATDAHNENRGLPMGPIGVACNGVIFFNPFDADSVEAIWRLDRCCGHPSPGFEYHYHKYPVCVKSPWADDGTAHSPLLGFAFDGFPIFGPYEAVGELAKDSTKNPLNAFNVHYDEARGWHYHVTPGKFPHLIGGYWGVANIRNRPPRPRRGPGGDFGPGPPR
jgi:YHYH protein